MDEITDPSGIDAGNLMSLGETMQQILAIAEAMRATMVSDGWSAELAEQIGAAFILAIISKMAAK